jgi:hypothetical protein
MRQASLLAALAVALTVGVRLLPFSMAVAGTVLGALIVVAIAVDVLRKRPEDT